MRMVYTNSNRFIVGNARNILEAQGFELFLKNGFDYLPYIKSSSREDAFFTKSYTFADTIVEKLGQLPTFGPSIATSIGLVLDRSPLLEEHRAHCKEVLDAKVDFAMVAEGSIELRELGSGSPGLRGRAGQC